MVYLDNAATSWPKPDLVYERMMDFMKSGCANPGRSSHGMARIAANEVMKTRELLARLFNVGNPFDIIFTANATYALNMAIQGVLKKGDHVVTTSMEHNSVLRPLYHMQKAGIIDYTIVKPKNEIGETDAQDIKAAVRPETKLIACTAASNVTGTIQPFVRIGEIAREKGLLFLVDAAQGAGILDFDVQSMNISLLAFPGHKSLLGPQGTGGLYVNPDVGLNPIIFGGTGSRSFETIHPDFMPDKLEGGTLNTPGIVGLGAGVEWILKKGLKKIRLKKQQLIDYLYNKIDKQPGIRIYSGADESVNSGIIAFIIEDMDSSEIGNILDSKYNIASRSGFHCAPLAHKALGSMDAGLVRLSPGYFSSVNEMEYAANAIISIASERQAL